MMPTLTDNQKNIAYAMVFIMSSISTVAGWHANNFTRYVIEMHRKAELCNKLHCDKTETIALRLKELQ